AAARRPRPRASRSTRPGVRAPTPAPPGAARRRRRRRPAGPSPRGRSATRPERSCRGRGSSFGPASENYCTTAVRVVLADPAAFTPQYDHELAAALARTGAEVELLTSRFRFGEAPVPDGYRREEAFYPVTTRIFG